MKKSVLLIILFLALVSGFQAQSIVSVTPNSGTIGQTLNVKIKGSKTHFKQANGNTLTLGFFKNSSGVNFVTVVHDSELIVNFTIPATVLTDDYDVIITNNIDGNILSYNGFFVSGVSHPRIVSVSPAIGNMGQTLNVNLKGSGTHFKKGNLMAVYFGFAQGSTAVNTMTVVNDTVVDLNISVPANTITGNYDVEIYNSIDSSLVKRNIFYINGMPKPGIVSVSPTSGNAGQTLDVDIVGTNTHFTQAVTKAYFGFLAPGANINSVTVINDSLLTANVSIPSDAVTGCYDVSINNTIDRYISKFKGFCVNGTPAPSIVSVTPASGAAGETMDISILANSTHFLSGNTSTIYFVQGDRSIITNSFTRVNDTILNVNITIPPTSPQGYYNLYTFNFTDKAVTHPNAFLVDGYAAINEFENASEPYQAYPNPFDNQFFIDYEMNTIGNVNIELYDISGKKISSLENGIKSPGKYQASFLGEGLTPGFYLVRIELNAVPFYYKMIKS